MTPDEVHLLRSLAATESSAVRSVMSGEKGEMLDCLDPRTAALVRIGALIGVDPDPSALRWAIDEGVAAGVADEEVVHAVMIVAPLIGIGRVTSALPKLLAALDIDIIGD